MQTNTSSLTEEQFGVTSIIVAIRMGAILIPNEEPRSSFTCNALSLNLASSCLRRSHNHAQGSTRLQ